MKIAVVVAVYQNEGTIYPTYERIRDTFARQRSDEFEIVFVDDGSTDESLSEIIRSKSEDDRVKAISFTRNFGQMAAMLAGFREATGDAIVNISADLQDPVDLLPQMIEKWKSGAEIVICHRKDRSDSFGSKLFSRLAYGVLRMSVPQIPPGGFDFVLMSRNVVDVFNSIDVRHRFFQGDLLWTGYRTCFIPYVRMKRTVGKSQYTLAKKLKNFIDALLDSSYLPIRFISFAGVVMSLLGVLYMLTIIYSWLHGETPFTGWAPIMMAIFIVGGMIMCMLGVIGEYIWRIYEEVRKRPNYLIRKRYF